jgi:hypothetical protein
MVDNMKLEVIKDFKHAVISIAETSKTVAIVEAKTEYIPIGDFKKIFEAIGDIVKEKGITKLVFDKRNLTVFHQPSMEWYFTEWKEQMFALGLKTHRKILPANDVFRQSVKIGRDKINKAFPQGKFHQMDIGYAETLEDAINN